MSTALETMPETAACEPMAAEEHGAQPTICGPRAFASDMQAAGEAGPRQVLPARPVPQHGFLQSVQSLLYIITVALFIIAFVAQPFRIPSESMVPTLLVGDFLLVDKQVGPEPHFSPLAPANAIHRGDLIVFHYPVEPSLHLVKRVVGLPGDRIHLRDGRVVVNGQSLSEPYAIFRPAVADSFRDNFPHFSAADPGVDSRWWIQMRSLVQGGDLTIPAGHFFVLGDNRNNSEDSRYWGLVPTSDIVGKPFLVYFSLSNPPALGRMSFAASRRPVTSGTDVEGSAERPADSTASPRPGITRWSRAFHVIR